MVLSIRILLLATAPARVAVACLRLHKALRYGSCVCVRGLGEEEDRQAGRGKEAEQASVYDGMEILGTAPARLRFGKDLRLLEVRPSLDI